MQSQCLQKIKNEIALRLPISDNKTRKLHKSDHRSFELHKPAFSQLFEFKDGVFWSTRIGSPSLPTRQIQQPGQLHYTSKYDAVVTPLVLFLYVYRQKKRCIYCSLVLNLLIFILPFHTNITHNTSYKMFVSKLYFQNLTGCCMFIIAKLTVEPCMFKTEC